MRQRIARGDTPERALNYVSKALDRPDHPDLGEDVGRIAGLGPLGVPLSATLDVPLDAMIDFSLPAGTLALAKVCQERSVPLVVGTTGFEP